MHKIPAGKKIEPALAGNGTIIHTERRAGYVFTAEVEIVR